MSKPTKLGVLGSTQGTDLLAIIAAIEAGELDATLAVVISNKAQALILERARRHGLKAACISSKGMTREAYDAQVSSLLEKYRVELVLLIGYMRILSAPFVQRWRNRLLNVHPSLLPDFAGSMDLEVHTEVLKAGVKETGCTVHFVTEEVDSGPIVMQKRCAVGKGDTPETLKQKVQALEGPALIEAIQLYRTGKLQDLFS